MADRVSLALLSSRLRHVTNSCTALPYQETLYAAATDLKLKQPANMEQQRSSSVKQAPQEESIAAPIMVCGHAATCSFQLCH